MKGHSKRQSTKKGAWKEKSLRSTFGPQCLGSIVTAPASSFGSSLRDSASKVSHQCSQEQGSWNAFMPTVLFRAVLLLEHSCQLIGINFGSKLLDVHIRLTWLGIAENQTKSCRPTYLPQWIRLESGAKVAITPLDPSTGTWFVFFQPRSKLTSVQATSMF